MRKPRRFTDEFKREAVALLQTSGRPLIQIARELGIQPSMLRNWRKIAGMPAGAALPSEMQATPPQAGSPGEQSAEITRLKREVERLRMERDILKKTVAIFSEPPK
jgi:transposase